MGGVIEAAGAILARAERRTELAAQNIANITTPGYKAHRSFQNMIADDLGGDNLGDDNLGNDDLRADASAAPGREDRDWSDGKLIATHNPLDLALAGNGFFVVRSGGTTYYTRSGRFSRDTDGHLVAANGAAVQGAAGDIVVDSDSFKVDTDGTVHRDDGSAQQFAVVDFQDKSILKDAGNGLFTAPAGSARGQASADIRQGMIEAANVSDSTEMTVIMASLRSAETGQHLAQLYDDLMSQAANSFGQETA